MNARVANVFISSTFADMHAERDILSRRVFPRLRDRFAPSKISICEVDLRWGVTEAMAANEGAVDICLDEIERCSPLVFGMAGHRVGWTPTIVSNHEERYRLLNDSGLFGMFRKRAENAWSMTEIELRFASALASRRKVPGPVVFFRSPTLTKELAEQGSVFDDAMTDMRKRIRGLVPAARIADYETLEEFEAYAEERLAMLLEEFSASAPARVERTVAAEAPRIASLSEIAKQSLHQTPLVVTGPPGVGASWILERFIRAEPGKLLDGRRATIQEIAAELAGDKRQIGRIVDLKSAISDLAPGRYVIDHFEDAFGAVSRADVGQLPARLPTGVQLVVMMRAPRLLDDANARRLPVVKIPLLEISERARFIQAFLRAYGKSVEDAQASRLASSPWASRIGAIVLSLNELRRFGSFESLQARIDELAALDDDTTLAAEVLRGLEAVLPTPLKNSVRTTTAAIALSLRGLEEYLICDVLAPDDPAAARYWTTLRVSLGAALAEVNGRTVLSSGPLQSLIVSQLESERVLAVNATAALQSALANAPLQRRTEEAPRIAMVEGGEAGLRSFVMKSRNVLDMVDVGPTFTEGWLGLLSTDDRRAVCRHWHSESLLHKDIDVWPLADLAARTGCAAEAIALLELDIERRPERPERAALRAFLEPTPANLDALDAELQRRNKASQAPGADDAASALTLLDAHSDGRMELPRQRLLELEAMVPKSPAFNTSPGVQAHLAIVSGQRLLLEANWKAALSAFQTAGRLYRQTGDGTGLCRALDRGAASMLELGDFKSSRRAASESLEISRAAALAEFEALAFERLIEIEKRRANWTEAFEHAEAYLRRANEGGWDVARARRALDHIAQV